MSAAPSDELPPFIVRRSNNSFELRLQDASEPRACREIAYEVWLAVVPIVLSLDTGLAARLSEMKIRESVKVAAREDMRSLYSLTALLEGAAWPARAASIARCWAKLPLSQQIGWGHDATQDMPAHAQLLASSSDATICLQSTMPAWLPSLVKASKKSFFEGRPLYWTFAETSIGSSCIAWIGPDGADPQACLAISTCPVQFTRAEDPDLSRAKAAIEKLTAAWSNIQSDPELGERVGLHATGHDVLEIHDTLEGWKDHLNAAAEVGAASGLSTIQIWKWINDHDRERAAG